MKGTILTLHSKGKDDERIVRIVEPGVDAGEYFLFSSQESMLWVACGQMDGMKKCMLVR